jgi:hypothetical protein
MREMRARHECFAAQLLPLSSPPSPGADFLAAFLFARHAAAICRLIQRRHAMLAGLLQPPRADHAAAAAAPRPSHRRLMSVLRHGRHAHSSPAFDHAQADTPAASPFFFFFSPILRDIAFILLRFFRHFLAFSRHVAARAGEKVTFAAAAAAPRAV